MSQRFLGHPVQESPLWGGWIRSRHQLGGPGVLCTSSSKPSEGKVMLVWAFWCTGLLCHLGKKARAVVSTSQCCPSMHCLLAALVGCLGLVWPRSLGLMRVSCSLGCSDHALVWALRVKWGALTLSISSSHMEGVLAPPSLFGRVLGVLLLYASCSFKLKQFFFVKGHVGLMWARELGSS